MMGNKTLKGVVEIYAVAFCDYDEYQIYAQFTNREEAEKYCDRESTRRHRLQVDEYLLADTVEELDKYLSEKEKDDERRV